MRTEFKLPKMGLLLMLLTAFITTSCDKDDEKVNAAQIRQALFDMKGSYHGTIRASFYQGAEIVKIENAQAVSQDSLTLVMPLEPLTSTLTDGKVIERLNNIGTIEVKAGYKFYQIDDDGETVFFVLTPQKVIIPVNEEAAELTIVFADSYGGSFEKRFNSIIFNLSPKEIWIGGTKLASFKQLVYHFQGSYE